MQTNFFSTTGYSHGDSLDSVRPSRRKRKVRSAAKGRVYNRERWMGE